MQKNGYIRLEDDCPRRCSMHNRFGDTTFMFKGERYFTVECSMVRDVFPFSQTRRNVRRAAHVDETSRFLVHRSLKNSSLGYFPAVAQSHLMESDQICEGEL